MLSSSIRRAAWAPIGPISGIARASSHALPGSSNGLLGATQHVRQRRYSSSSSSKPSDGSQGIESSSQTPAKGVNSGEKREGKASKRRGSGNSRTGSKSNQNAAFSKLPSVPSTQHLQPHDVQVASFFSIHRPISVSTTVPPTSSSEAFDAIFAARKPSKQETEDVIFTLSSAVDSMEGGASEQDGAWHNLEGEGSPLEGMNMSDLSISVEELTKRLRPFHPPPPPVPYDEAKAAAAAAADAATKHDNSYSSVLTIHESKHADGSRTYEAHTTPFVRSTEMDAPGAADADAAIDVPHSNTGTTYLERLRNNRTMHAISTKRRRKLKMKKHKYKKLLRNTRTLRRKLDKA